MPASLSAEMRHLNEYHDTPPTRNNSERIKRYVFPKGTVLFQKGDKRECAFLIEEGKVNIRGNDEGGEEKLLCVLGEGEIFGEMALIDDTPRSATAITATECEIFIIPRNALHEKIKGLDPIVSLLISLLIQRYRITRINMPASIKEGGISDFISKISKDEKLPEDILQLKNMKEQRDTLLKEIKLEQELRNGLENREFIPFFQPIVNLQDQSLVGFEALIRWQHPNKGLLVPNDFIPVAERTGVVMNLDHMMLEKACEILPSLQNKMGDTEKKLFVSVNLSGIHFGTLDIVDMVRQTLLTYDIDPALIKLEITESALIGDPDHAEKILKGLKALGVQIALDDFGTGYSSLGYLHKFPIDILKIDRSFISKMHDGQKSLDIVKAIIALARTFELDIVAEGIEQENDIVALNSMGCDMAQGYFFARPMSIDDTYAYIEKTQLT